MDVNEQRTSAASLSETGAIRARAKHGAAARTPRHAASPLARPVKHGTPEKRRSPENPQSKAAANAPADALSPLSREQTQVLFERAAMADAPARNRVPAGGNAPKPSPGGAARVHVPAWRAWVARLTVLAVFFLNVMCALQFIVLPSVYAPAYELPTSPETSALVAGLGVAFLMWNVTYPAVIVDPARFRALHAVVLLQQLVGLLGESFILMRLYSAGLADGAMAAGILRFIAFDGGGLLLMLVGFILVGAGRRA